MAAPLRRAHPHPRRLQLLLQLPRPHPLVLPDTSAIAPAPTAPHTLPQHFQAEETAMCPTAPEMASDSSSFAGQAYKATRISPRDESRRSMSASTFVRATTFGQVPRIARAPRMMRTVHAGLGRASGSGRRRITIWTWRCWLIPCNGFHRLLVRERRDGFVLEQCRFSASRVLKHELMSDTSSACSLTHPLPGSKHVEAGFGNIPFATW